MPQGLPRSQVLLGKTIECDRLNTSNSGSYADWDLNKIPFLGVIQKTFSLFLHIGRYLDSNPPNRPKQGGYLD